jgi:hypothetical protein
MQWSLTQMPTSERLMTWETMCNLIDGPPAVFLCQYDLTHFPGSVVIDALKTHPLCIILVLRDENGLAYYPIAPDQLVRVFYRVGEQPTPRRRPKLPQDLALPKRASPTAVSGTGGAERLVRPAVYRGEPLHLERVYHYGYYNYCYTPPPVYYAPQSPEVQNMPLMLFAFREGAIQPQTHQSGYLYFQTPSASGQRFTLHVHVQDAAHAHHDKPAESATKFRVPFALR